MHTDLAAGPRKKRRRSGRWIGLVLCFAFALAAAMWWRSSLEGNTSFATPEYTAKPHAIMADGAWTGEYADGKDEGLLIPLDTARSLLGEGVAYEKKTDSIILTSDKEVLHFKTGALDATLNSKPTALRFAAKNVDGKVLLPVAPLTELFGLKVEIGNAGDIVTLLMPGEAVQRAEVTAGKKKGIELREGAGKKFAIVERLDAGAGIRLWGEEDGWYKAQSENGHIGYVAKVGVTLLSIEQVPLTGATEEPFVAWHTAGKRINLTWEAVYTKNPDTDQIGELTGVNVVSPSWFELIDGKGSIRSKGDAAYSSWARAKGIQVWGMFSNGFEPDRTHEALSSFETRSAMIRQLLAYAKTFKLQGINIDFENVYTKDKENLVQFVREMTPLLHEQNLVVSIDVTPKSGSEMWSAFLDRAKLGAVVDYMMVMAYDEHWASSPEAGSVSSLPWAENSVKRILEEDQVPSDKLILGVPFYTRIWTEEPDGKGGTKVSSKTMDMDAVNALIAEKKLKPALSEETGQKYVAFKDGNAVKKIWIEDASTIVARAKLANDYDLAGVASWRRGFESQDVWAALDQALQSGP
ncbi:glycosyl hydrolase family 18 protein [Cohnella suwonensis]|uniref:Glycosyl hydrolase family 18 protein n=1 Tax=Cohnella suwonensis TaxID=696072 RepID=A0ABW0LS10_9BACL